MKSKSKKKAVKSKKPAKKKKAAPRIAKKKKMPERITPEETAAITMVVDESSSMTGLFDATVAGFNEYVETTKRALAADRTYFSALCFNTSGVRILQRSAPLKDALRLGTHNYCPGGGTPLLDAVGAAIVATDQVVRAEGIAKAIVVIQTDGQENASIKYTLADIKVMIEDRQAKGWQFVFIGAGINAFADATAMGISAMNTMSYTADTAGTRNTYGSAAANTVMYATGTARNMNFSLDQSAASGESGLIYGAKVKAEKAAQEQAASS